MADRVAKFVCEAFSNERGQEPNLIWVCPDIDYGDSLVVVDWSHGTFQVDDRSREMWRTDGTAYVRADLALPEPDSESQVEAVERMARAIHRQRGSFADWGVLGESQRARYRKEALAALRALREGGE